MEMSAPSHPFVTDRFWPEFLPNQDESVGTWKHVSAEARKS